MPDDSPLVLPRLLYLDRMALGVVGPLIIVSVRRIGRRGRMLLAEDAALGICTYAPTRAELKDQVYLDIAFLWREYACGDPAGMTEEALALRARLHDRLYDIQTHPA